MPIKKNAPQCWQDAERIIAAGARRILLYGPPGTGKTYAAKKASLNGRRIYNVYVSEESAAYQIVGKPVIREGNMIWEDGPATLSWRQGGRLVVNELDKASGDTLDALLAFCDDPESAGFTLETGEYIEPAEGFQVIATMNGDPEDLPEALAERFTIRVEITEPHPDAIAALSEALQPVARELAGTRVTEDRRVSIRQFRAHDELTSLGLDDETASRASFHHRAPEVLSAIGAAGMVAKKK